MLRYAPLGESCNVSSPRIENPYQSSAYAPVKPTPPRDTHDACHAYLRDVYDRVGVPGLLDLMDGDMIRDIKTTLIARHGNNKPPFHIDLGFEELAVLLVGAFLLILLID